MDERNKLRVSEQTQFSIMPADGKEGHVEVGGRRDETRVDGRANLGWQVAVKGSDGQGIPSQVRFHGGHYAVTYTPTSPGFVTVLPSHPSYHQKRTLPFPLPLPHSHRAMGRLGPWMNAMHYNWQLVLQRSLACGHPSATPKYGHTRAHSGGQS